MKNFYLITRTKSSQTQYLGVNLGRFVWFSVLDRDRVIKFYDKESAELFATIDHYIPGKEKLEVIMYRD